MQLDIDPALLSAAAERAIIALFTTSDWRGRIADSFAAEFAGLFKSTLRHVAGALSVDPDLIRVAREQAREAFLTGVRTGAEEEGRKAGIMIAKGAGKLAQMQLIEGAK